MEKKTLVQNYEKEYSGEIGKISVDIDQLKKVGVAKETLAGELYLRNFYGDEIVKTSNGDDVSEGLEKKVVKIGEEEKNIDKELKSIWNDIEESEFDKNLDSLF